MDEAPDRIRAARLDKLGRVEEAGVRAYPTTFGRTHLAGAVSARFEQLDGQHVCVAGRLGVFRTLGKNLAFVFVHDDSGEIQLLIHPSELDERSRLVFEALDPADFVGACGTVTRTRRGEVSVEVEQVELLAKALRNPPEKWHGLQDVETRYRQRYLDLMANPETRQVFLTRSRVVGAIRAFLNARGFIEVDTPILQPIPGGGAARPFSTASNALGAELYLRIALELYLKRLIVGGLERVYEIGKNFRNEGISHKHNPEFTVLEWYEAYADWEVVADRMERLVAGVASVVGSVGSISWERPWARETLAGSIAARTDGLGVLAHPSLSALPGG